MLVEGNEEKIQEARKTYWRIYDREYKRRKRTKEKREFRVSFDRDEVAIVRAAATAKGLKPAEYIREATRADIRKASVTPHPYLLKEVQQLLLRANNDIQLLKERDTKGWLGANRDYDRLERIVAGVEAYVVGLFREPLLLREGIEQTLRANPNYIHTLRDIIHRYGD